MYNEFTDDRIMDNEIMDDEIFGVVEKMASITGLPKEIWPSPAPLQHVSRRLHFKLDELGTVLSKCKDKIGVEGLRCHPKTLQAIEKLPAAHVIGQSVLMRLSFGVTTMTTIAEAACATFGSGLAELLWVILQVLERSMRPPNNVREKQYFYLWDDEITVHPSQLHTAASEQHQVQLPREKSQSSHQRYFTSWGSYIETARTWDGDWILYSGRSHEDETRLMLDWIEYALGGWDFERLSRTQYMKIGRLETEKTIPLPTSPPILKDCWRQKITSGNVHILASQPEKIRSNPESHKEVKDDARDITYMISRHFPGSLVLTAAALWSLFDNILEENPRCKCTFIVQGGAYLQCREQWKGWLVWHLATGESNPNLCKGDQCHLNVRVSFSEEQDCVTIQTTKPCILGWNVESRTEPTTPLWDILPVTRSFKRKELTSYNLKELQVQAQLSAPLVVNPLIGGAATFGKTHYGIEESIDSTSLLALEVAAVATVLIYDEFRGVHLLCEGADIIELICMQYLRRLGLQNSDLPAFNHHTALGRCRTWYSSAFVLRSGNQISGDQLVRQATSIVSQLQNAVEKASKVSLPYWLLEEVIRGGLIHPVKRPHAKKASWEALASQSPPLILAVGSIHEPLMSATGQPFSRPAARGHIRLLQRFTASESSGVITDLSRMGIWLTRAEFIQNMTLCRTNDTVQFGNDRNDHDFVLQVKDCQTDEKANKSFEELCRVCIDGSISNCVHFIR
ncbi:MAG: hypothetical protein Q9167_007464 [Letrouitia subvulpina]